MSSINEKQKKKVPPKKKAPTKKKIVKTKKQTDNDDVRGSIFSEDFLNKFYSKFSPKESRYIRGRIVSGFPDQKDLDPMLKYKFRLTTYEMIAFDVRDQRFLCNSCYSYIWNRSRFGLCPDCFNDNLVYLYACDCKIGKIYLTRLGAKIRIIGPSIELQTDLRANGKLNTMTFPYVNLMTPDKPRDLIFHTRINGVHKPTKIKAHSALPFDYMVAELF